MRVAISTVIVAALAGTGHARPVHRVADTCHTNPLAKGCDAGKPDPAEAADPTPLHARVKTTTPRAKLSARLVAPAEKAAKANAWAKAIPYYQALVAARGPGSPEARRLAELWTRARQNEQAIEAWTAYATATTGTERATALAEATRLGATPDPFADRLELVAHVAEARRMFARGRAAYRAKRYGDALVYFHMGHALAPDLAGFLRELGATYDKLGAAAEKRELYRRYLVQRPFGPNADHVRAELAKQPGVLGKLRITSSLPCTELWLNRQKITGKLPAAGLTVAPGRYKGLCFNPKYEMALFEYATVAPGQPATMTFSWAIVENRLEHPFGRIALENPKSPGTMIDLGITAREIGVAAPRDGRPLRMVLKDDSGLRTEHRTVRIAPGQRLVVTW